MTLLTSDQKAAITFHYQQTISPHLPLELKIILETDFNPTTSSHLTAAITECDTAYNDTRLKAGSLIEESREETTQDITVTYPSETVANYGDRTKITRRRPSYNQRRTAYYKEVEKLIKILGYEQRI